MLNNPYYMIMKHIFFFNIKIKVKKHKYIKTKKQKDRNKVFGKNILLSNTYSLKDINI